MGPIVKYFTQERTGSILFITVGTIALAIALYFFLGLKTSFTKGIAIPLAFVSMLEIAGGTGVFLRSSKDIKRVENFLKNEPHNISAVEIPRMKTVMRNFVMYRNVEIILIALSILLIFATAGASFWKGLGIGLLIQTVLVLGLDYFSEKRGHVYMNYLQTIAENI